MSTTTVVAEILIAGLQTIAWLVVVFGLLAGSQPLDVDLTDSWKKRADVLQPFLPLVMLFVVAVAYTLGVIVDRVADVIDDQILGIATRLRARWQRLSRREQAELTTGYGNIPIQRLVVMQKSPEITKFLEYQRSRLRVTRATALNLALCLGAMAFVAMRGGFRPGSPVIEVSIGVLVALLLASFSWFKLDTTFVTRLRQAFDIVQERKLVPGVVAAICYQRQGATGLALMLVQTKGKKWIFPKGHVEAGESESQAAAREAREEAGVRGPVEDEAFATYTYPKYRRGHPDQSKDLVKAYLLEVKETRKAKERWRNPTLFALAAAKMRLREGQEEWYVRQIDAVVDLAVARLDSPAADGTESASGKT